MSESRRRGLFEEQIEMVAAQSKARLVLWLAFVLIFRIYCIIQERISADRISLRLKFPLLAKPDLRTKRLG